MGFLLAPAAYEVVRSRYTRLADLDSTSLTALLAEMEAEATSIAGVAAPDVDLTVIRHGYARYVGQGHEIKIELPDGPFMTGPAMPSSQVRAAYAVTFGLLVPGMEIELLTWSLTASADTAPGSSSGAPTGLATRITGPDRLNASCSTPALPTLSRPV